MSTRFDDLRTVRFENWYYHNGSPVNVIYGEPGWVCQDQTNGNLWVHGAGNNTANWFLVSTASPLIAQQGDIALVDATQSYALVFPTPFALPPTFVIASIHLPGPAGAGEAFFVSPDRSTLTNLGVTFWLSGLPTPAAVGGFINWLARA